MLPRGEGCALFKLDSAGEIESSEYFPSPRTTVVSELLLGRAGKLEVILQDKFNTSAHWQPLEYSEVEILHEPVDVEFSMVPIEGEVESIPERNSTMAEIQQAVDAL